MNALNRQTLATLVKQRGLEPARLLPVGQLRIATIPSVLRPARHGVANPLWLEPLRVPANGLRK